MFQRWNSTLIQRWNSTLIQRWNSTLIQRWNLTSVQSQNQTFFDVVSTLKVDVVSTLKQRRCACWVDICHVNGCQREREREREREGGGRGVYLSLLLALTLISKCMDEHVNDLKWLLKNDIRTISKTERTTKKSNTYCFQKHSIHSWLSGALTNYQCYIM